MSSLDGFDVCVLSDKDQCDVMELMSVAYTPKEPLSCGLKCSKDDLLPYFEKWMDPSFRSRASLGLRDKTHQKLIGIILNMIVTDPDAQIFYNGGFSTEKSNLYSKVVYNSFSDVNVLKEDGMKKQLEILFLTVHPEYCKRRLATELVRMSEEKAQELGCDIATIQATSPITEGIVMKLGYITVRTLDVSTIQGENGKTLLDLSAMNGTTQFSYLKKCL